MLQEIKEGIIVDVKITPKSSKNEIVGWENGLLKIKVKEIAEKGKANKELINFLAKTLHRAKSDIKIIQGERGRIKKIQINNLSRSEAEKILQINL